MPTDKPRRPPHPLKGKQVLDYYARTFYVSVDIDGLPQYVMIGKHYSLATALNRFVALANFWFRVYHRRVYTVKQEVKLFDTGAWQGVDRKPSKLRELALNCLTENYATYKHRLSCASLLDEPCDCHRKEMHLFLWEHGRCLLPAPRGVEELITNTGGLNRGDRKPDDATDGRGDNVGV